MVYRGILRKTIVKQRQTINSKGKENKPTHQDAQKVMMKRDVLFLMPSEADSASQWYIDSGASLKEDVRYILQKPQIDAKVKEQ